jgi:Cu2+-exporting ATPase
MCPNAENLQTFRPWKCCNNSKTKQGPAEEVCCGKSEVFSSDTDAAALCCRASQPPLKRGQPSIISTPHPGLSDLEKGGTGLDHVTLGVQGLTCTACETKLKRALDSIAAVRNPQTSLLLSQAEFDFDTSVGTVNEAIRSIERTTRFICQRISPKGTQS